MEVLTSYVRSQIRCQAKSGVSEGPDIQPAVWAYFGRASAITIQDGGIENPVYRGIRKTYRLHCRLKYNKISTIRNKYQRFSLDKVYQ